MDTIFEERMASIENAASKDQLFAYGIALCIGLLLFVYVLSRSVGKRKLRLPPGPFKWPVFGHLFLGGKYPHQVFAQLATQYGNIMSLFFGSVRVVIVSDASMAKELFSVSDVNFASRPIHDLMYTPSKYMNYGEENVSIAINTYNPKVREMRQLCISELFTTQKLELRKSTRMEEVRRTIAALAMADRNSPVEIRPVVSEFSLRISCRTTFNKAFLHSESLPSSGSGLHPQAFRRLETENTMLLSTHNILDVIPVLRLVFGHLDLQGIDARWKELTKQKVNCADSILEWYRKHVSNGSVPAEASEIDFVETLLRLSEDGKYTVATIRSIIFELLTAATDTVAATFEWALLELVRHPQCMERLHAEIDAKFGMIRPVEENEAGQLPYLQAVLKEVLRLHMPTTLGLPHSNMEDATLGGYHIPARTTVLANFWAMNRDPIVWGDDSSMFNPDRFLDSDLSVNGTNYQYLPFGAGRRICPGRALAMRTLSAALGSFVHAFEWSALPGVELTANEGTNGLNIRPETPLVLQTSLRPAASVYLTPSTSTFNA